MRGVRLVDVVTAAAVTTLAVGVTVVADAFSPLDRTVDGYAIALAAVAGVMLLVRRRHPLVTLTVVTAACTTYLLLGYPYGPILVAFFVAVYTVARYEPWRRSVPASLLAMAVLLTHLITSAAAFGGAYGLLPGSAWAIVPFAIGVVLKVRAESGERDRAEEVRQRAYEERLRVAREVHDVVGHGLAAIKMQAEVALHLLPGNPEQAETALANISRTSTEALSEVRSTLAVVRRQDDTRAPAGLAQLDELRQRLGRSGARIDVTTVGAPGNLPVAVDLAGYRVVQESLTNVLRHGASSDATVHIEYRPDAVLIAVANRCDALPARTDGHGIDGHGIQGHGIAGMRQRVRALGGTFTAGPAGGGRFEVHATIPREARS